MVGLDINNFTWDDDQHSLNIGYLKREDDDDKRIDAWATFTVSLNKNATSKNPSFKYKIKILDGTKDDVDMNTLPAGLSRHAKIWPTMCADLWKVKYKDHMEKEQERRVAEKARREKTDEVKTKRTRNPYNAVEPKAAPQDKALESQLMDLKTDFPTKKLEEFAEYLRGRFQFKTGPSAETVVKMRSWSRVSGRYFLEAPPWLEFLKKIKQPLRTTLPEDEKPSGKRQRSQEPEIRSKRLKVDLPPPDTYVALNGQVRECHEGLVPEYSEEAEERIRELLRHVKKVRATFSDN